MPFALLTNAKLAFFESAAGTVRRGFVAAGIAIRTKLRLLK
jgi:hypothetical protein